MKAIDADGQLGNIVEQKILEFFGDPDAGLTLTRKFARTLNERTRKNQKLTGHAAVLKKYGVR